jgi:hypothetical protein
MSRIDRVIALKAVRNTLSLMDTHHLSILSLGYDLAVERRKRVKLVCKACSYRLLVKSSGAIWDTQSNWVHSVTR